MKHENAITEQEIHKLKLDKIQLEEDIDAQVDKKIAIQQNMQRARKQIARTINKTQTFLVQSEKLLKEKLLNVKSMNHEMARLEKERAIVQAKKDEAERAYYSAQQQRTDMMMHFNRMQDERDQERKISEGLRQKRREETFKLGNKVIMLSTKAVGEDGDQKRYDAPLGDEIQDAESKLRRLTTELQRKQRDFMRVQTERELMQQKKTLQSTKHGF